MRRLPASDFLAEKGRDHGSAIVVVAEDGVAQGQAPDQD